MYNISRGMKVTPFDKTIGKDWNRFVASHTGVSEMFRQKGYVYVYKRERFGDGDEDVALILANDPIDPTSSAEFRISDVYPFPIPQEKRLSLENEKHHIQRE